MKRKKRINGLKEPTTNGALRQADRLSATNNPTVTSSGLNRELNLPEQNKLKQKYRRFKNDI